MRPRKPRCPLFVCLAAPLLFAVSPVFAQTLETFVLSVGGVSTGPGCSTFTTPAPVLAFFGTQGVAESVPGYPACGIAGGWNDQIQPTAPLMDSGGLANGWVSGSFSGGSSATARYGSIAADGNADYTGESSSLTVVGAEAFGRWNDTFTLTSPSVANGQTGNLVLKVTVAGGLSTTGTGLADVELFLGIDADIPEVVFRSQANYSVINASLYSTTGTGLGGFSVSPGAMSGSGEISTVQIPFVFGTPVDLHLGMLCVAQPVLTSVIHSNFTADVTGLEVALTGGAPVTDFIVGTASGTPYGSAGLVDVVPAAHPMSPFGRLIMLSNPSRSGAEMRFVLAAPGSVRLSISDASGRRVRTLRNGTFGAGTQSARWDGRSESGVPLASGVYFARLSWPGGSSSARFVMLR